MAKPQLFPPPRQRAAAAAATIPKRPVVMAPHSRLASIDALRGFNMFWIIGGGTLLQAVIRFFAGELPNAVQHQMSLAKWEGFTAWNLIMPLFLFLAGTAMSFSLSRRIENGHSHGRLYKKVFQRVAALWLLGMIVQGNLLTFNFWQLRLYSSPLQAIAVGYLIAAIAMFHLERWEHPWVTILLLAGFWLIVRSLPFGGHALGTLEENANIALYIDKLILGPFRDPDTTFAWILPGLGFGATVILGMTAGYLLQSQKSDGTKVAWLGLIGLACLALGWFVAGGLLKIFLGQAPETTNNLLRGFWSIRFPIIQHIWTSSMVLWAAGWSYLLLALFYLVIDVWQWRRWAMPFTVIGANAILAYMLAHLGRWLASFKLANRLVTPTTQTLIAFALLWGLLYYLHRRKWFLRV